MKPGVVERVVDGTCRDNPWTRYATADQCSSATARGRDGGDIDGVYVVEGVVDGSARC